jgi:hypothetical protein
MGLQRRILHSFSPRWNAAVVRVVIRVADRTAGQAVLKVIILWARYIQRETWPAQIAAFLTEKVAVRQSPAWIQKLLKREISRKMIRYPRALRGRPSTSWAGDAI